MKIFMFKTNIKESEKKMIGDILSQYRGIKKWKIDFENKNNVLQVDCYGVTEQKIIASIKAAGYDCKEIS